MLAGGCSSAPSKAAGIWPLRSRMSGTEVPLRLILSAVLFVSRLLAAERRRLK
jgi:hypothetical protein